MDSSWKKGISVGSILVIAAFMTVFSVINFCGFERFCTPDMYSDTYLTRMMWEEKTIFPETWVFGNQFYVVTTPVLAALLYGICGSINLSMALATTAMTVLILASFWWMVRPFAGRAEALFGMAVLAGCVIGPEIVSTIEGQIFYLMASYYAGYLVTLFVVFGDYTRAVTGKKCGWASLVLAVALSFCSGMQSLRQTAVMILPLLMVEGIRLLGLWLRRKREPVRWNWNAVVRTGLYTAGNLLGLAAIRILDPKCITMYGELTFNTLEQVPECIATGFRALRSITGLKYLASDTPWLGVVALVLTAAVAAALFLAARRGPRESDGNAVLLVLCACSILCVIAVSIVIDIYTRSIYIFTWYPLAALAAMVLMQRSRGGWKYAVGGVLAAALMCNLWLSYGSTVKAAVSGDETPQQQIADYLVENGYTRLYGQWTQIASIAVWTDGQVAAGSWTDEVCGILAYINPMDIYSEEDNATAAYLITAGNEQAFRDHADRMGAELTMVASFNGTGYSLYTSDRQLMFVPEN